MDLVKQNMKLVGVREEEAENRFRWRQMIRCGDSVREHKRTKITKD